MSEPATRSRARVLETFVATSRGGLRTLDCELVEDLAATPGGAVRLEYVIVAPFLTRGERHRYPMSWSLDYPAAKRSEEARGIAHRLACQMWGERC